MASVQFYNGKVLFVDGKVAMDPACCCTTSNPCDPNPEMLLTVSGSSGTINWCGETWNLPGDSGVQKSVCPTDYTKSVPTPSSVSHRWVYSKSGSTGLSLRRKFTGVGFNGIDLYPVASYAHFETAFSGTYYYANPTTWYPGLGPIPTTNDFYLGNAFFTSITVSGVTYTWQKGAGW